MIVFPDDELTHANW